MPNFRQCHVRVKAVYLIHDELYKTSSLLDAQLAHFTSLYMWHNEQAQLGSTLTTAVLLR
jgi:hypothetical protein